MSYSSIVVLTGAGISAESGIPTFRASDGLWCNHRIEDVATPEGFERNPELVHAFYNMRRKQLQDVAPNAAHLALAELGEKLDGSLFIVTQNVDDLHDRAEKGKALKPGYRLLHMHGELNKVRCTASEEVFDWHDDLTTSTLCPCCKKASRLRPHIVWFGEMPLEMELINHKLRQCDLFMSIGTSGNVYPAAGFVQEVRAYGRGHTVELNMEPSLGHSLFHEKIYGPAGKSVPEYIKRILSDSI